MNTERAQVGWGFWLWWVLASSVGFAVFGVAVGIAQWFVLRRQVTRAGWWVLASTLGFVVAVALLLALGESVSDAVGGDMGLVLSLAVFGAAIGIAQWIVLRRKVSRAGWWVLASTVGFAVGGALVLTAFRDYGLFIGVGSSVDYVSLVVGLPMYGAITGGVLVWLLRPPDEAELRARNVLLEKLRFYLDMSNRKWLPAAVILIVLIAGYFLFATIMVDEPIIERLAPPCSEARPGTIITCQIDRAYCNTYFLFDGPKTTCYDAPQLSSGGFTLLVAQGHDWSDLDGRCLLVTGEVGTYEVGTFGGDPSMMVDDRSQVEFCQ